MRTLFVSLLFALVAGCDSQEAGVEAGEAHLRLDGQEVAAVAVPSDA